MVGKNCKALSHFHRLTEYLVQCKHCEKTLSSKHTSSNLTRHLVRNHKSLARSIFADDEGKMLVQLKEELDTSHDIHMEISVADGETKNAIHNITEDRAPEPEQRNKIIGKNNKLWAHFHRISEFMAKCKHCSKTLSSKHSSSNLMRHIVRRHHNLSKSFLASSPKKDGMLMKVGTSQVDPLEKVDFDDVDSIIEKVADHLDDEVASISLQEPFYEYVVDNTEEVESKNLEQHHPVDEHQIDPHEHANSIIEPTTQLDEKLKAETIYYNEMAELARAKRRLINLQAKKLLLEMNLIDEN